MFLPLSKKLGINTEMIAMWTIIEDDVRIWFGSAPEEDYLLLDAEEAVLFLNYLHRTKEAK